MSLKALLKIATLHMQNNFHYLVLTDKHSENHLSFFSRELPVSLSTSCLISLDTLPHSKGEAPTSTPRSIQTKWEREFNQQPNTDMHHPHGEGKKQRLNMHSKAHCSMHPILHIQNINTFTGPLLKHLLDPARCFFFFLHNLSYHNLIIAPSDILLSPKQTFYQWKTERNYLIFQEGKGKYNQGSHCTEVEKQGY